jgi:hypothetical protein
MIITGGEGGGLGGPNILERNWNTTCTHEEQRAKQRKTATTTKEPRSSRRRRAGGEEEEEEEVEKLEGERGRAYKRELQSRPENRSNKPFEKKRRKRNEQDLDKHDQKN